MRARHGAGCLRWRARAMAAALRRCCAAMLLAALPSCGAEAPEAGPPAEAIVSRVITPDLWAGDARPQAAGLRSGAMPAIDIQRAGGLSIQGPVEVDGPAGTGKVRAYLRAATGAGGQRLQLLAVTQGGAGLGRIRDVTAGLPERRFEGDVMFPLGLWKQGEIRQFEATEFTLAGPAQRRLTLEILDLDFVYRGAAHSLAYRLTVRDAAARVIGCETSVYSPGAGLVRREASNSWLSASQCSACPCPG